MRLTLRTLLAYMDDTLEPSEARDLGRKVKESEFAQDLMERIRKVVRSRRLAAPSPQSRRVDANLVAEYLDNVLDAEELRRFEAACLKSDEELAEVAACHQILTLLGQPAHLDTGLKQRLYGLVSERIGVAPVEVPEGPSVGGFPGPGDEVPHLPLARFVVVGIVLLGLAVAIWKWGEWMSAQPAATASRTAVEEKGPRAEGTGLGEAQGDQEAERVEQKDVASGAEEAATEGGKPAASIPKEAEEAPKGAERTEPAAEPEGGESGREASTATKTGGTGGVSEPAVPAAEAEERTSRGVSERPASEAAEQVFGVLAASTGPVALLDPESRNWVVPQLPARVQPLQGVANLVGVRSRLDFGNWSVTLVDRTGVGLSPDLANEMNGPVLYVHFGRVVMKPVRTPGKLRVVCATGHALDLRFTSTDTVVAIQAEPVYRKGLTEYEVQIIAVRGTVEVEVLAPQPMGAGEGEKEAEGTKEGEAEPAAPGAAKEGQAGQGGATGLRVRYESVQTIRLDESKDLLLALGTQKWQLRDRLQLPDWVTGTGRDPVRQREVEAFLKTLRGERRLIVRLLELVHSKDTRPALKELALETLVALGRVSVPIEILRTAGNELLWQTAVRAIRWYLGLGAEEAMVVYDALKASFATEGEEGVARQLTEAAMLLLAGVPRESVREEGVREFLVAMLAPEMDLALRRLAFVNVLELTGSDFGYNPEAPSERAINAVRRGLERLAHRVGREGRNPRIP